jgi:hypothetical protein
VKTCREIADEAGARLTLTADLDAGVGGADYLYTTDVWVSMGEDPGAWDERIELLRPYQVNLDLVRRTGNPLVRFMHRLPAFHNKGHEGRRGHLPAVRARRPGGDRRRLRVALLHRVRPGGEPAAHDQGRHGGHPPASEAG